MVSCKHCTIQNSLDSTYCKRCGTVLDDADVQEATVKLTALIADGNRLFADGRTDEAMLVAENAVMSNPSSPAALSLKGMCHERLGQISEALECFEKVVTLNPDSTLDRLKINDLRNQLVALSVTHQHQARPNYRLATVAALAAVALVICGGALLAKANAQARQESHDRVASNTDVLGDNQQVAGFTGGGQATPPKQSTVPQTEGSGMQKPVLNNPANDGTQTPIPDYHGGGLPKVDGGAGTIVTGNGGLMGTVEPIHPQFPTDFKNAAKDDKSHQAPAGNTPPKQGSDEGEDPTPGVLTPDTPKSDPGIVEISVSKGSSGPTMGNGREALVHTARNQFQLGNYDAAARTFQRALRSGADQGTTNQRLGQCYERLGQTNEAIQAYQRAAAAYEAELKAGGDSSRVGAALESCRQALKVLQGK